MLDHPRPLSLNILATSSSQNSHSKNYLLPYSTNTTRNSFDISFRQLFHLDFNLHTF
ncbi:hypothetical protein M405DRAFT_834434 [Rhizopogon salebrosus TDB-379]|nr:hypothetical protein M405DRAFT_834434 [Rhizopogon salebrosus TDB-379]